MPLTCHPIYEVLKHDRRYAPQAYDFLRDAMEYAVQVLNMGRVRPTAPLAEGARSFSASLDPALKAELKRRRIELPEEEQEGEHRHLTGQELCEAVRRFALERFGFMAKCVLTSWGVRSTGDFGEMVFTMIRLGRMRKTEDDRREDFDHAFDFDLDLREAFEFAPADEGE